MHRNLRFALCLATALLALPATAGAAKPTGDVNVQLLGLNDFHGHLEPDPRARSSRSTRAHRGDPAVRAGGAEFLASHIRSLEIGNPNSLFVSAGDLIGASPLTSALFHDEPTIEAMNLMGLDLNAVGNHEFDEGTTELTRMQEGGCHPDGCYDSDGDGATAVSRARTSSSSRRTSCVRATAGRCSRPTRSARSRGSRSGSSA